MNERLLFIINGFDWIGQATTSRRFVQGEGTDGYFLIYRAIFFASLNQLAIIQV
jgi:hypothetical protein